LICQAEISSAMGSKAVQLLEGTGVYKLLKSFPGGQLALLMLLLNATLTTTKGTLGAECFKLL
jgi:hypothetical protein